MRKERGVVPRLLSLIQNPTKKLSDDIYKIKTVIINE